MTIIGDGSDSWPFELMLPLYPSDVWFEAPIWKGKGNPLLDALEMVVIHHLPRVIESARKLRADGWRIRLTICGLACRPPRRVEATIGDYIEGEESPWIEYFRRLELPIYPVDIFGAPRSMTEIMDAVNEATERVWYLRSVNSMIHTHDNPMNAAVPVPPPEVVGGMFRSQMRIEAKYGKDDLEAAADDPFEAGMLNGKLSALRWVLGDPWDTLDT